jgi:ATP-dependent exoDNAse (exonuclease V) alpha subunit
LILRESQEERIARIRDTFDNLQNRAVDAILDDCVAGDDFVFPIVDGPPGTGKTTVGAVAVAEYLQQRGPDAQVLYMCYTHYAASQAKETLEKKLGLSPERVIKLTYDTNKKDWDRGIVGCKSDLSDLSDNEIRRLKQCPVLLCTLHGAKRALEARSRHCKVIVDEFSQVDPAMFFSTVNKLRDYNPSGYALLGDPKQLPVVTTQPLLSSNIKNYLDRRKPTPSHELKLQHRMHENICAAVNSLRKDLSAYPIESSNEVRDRDLVSLGYKWDKSSTESKFKDILDPSKPFVIVNTDSFGEEYEQRVFKGSVKNVTEAKFATKLAKAFYSSFKKGDDPLIPAILSPYAAQVREISNNLPSALQERCLTVYRAQGREYPCVIVSFVRRNPQRTIGFLDDLILKAQTYVACSRAQGKLVVLFSFDTFLGAGHTAFEYLYQTPGAYIVKRTVL